MFPRWIWLACIASWVGAAPAVASVPAPAETPCDVIVSGRTSTLRGITVVGVGQEIPPTYSPSVKNTPGMEWYVSRHYALKTDGDEAKARRYLGYAELAYPFHAWILGRTPPDQDRLRMPFVLAANLEKMLDTIQGDGGFRPEPAGVAGGITYWRMRTAYNYPSGALRYHQRDLVLHENLHLMQMCCEGASPPRRLLEGITYTASHHVYDDAKSQLTLAVFDKGTVNMQPAEELKQQRKDPLTFRQVCATNQRIVLFTHFLWSDPERLMQWRVWRDAMLWEGKTDDDLKIMEEVFGPLDGEIERQWQAWVAARHQTFEYRDWGWEQSADTLSAYGWPKQGPYARTDILLPPGEEPSYDPLRMDYPLQPMSPLVGPVARGVREPAVGALISFARCTGRGIAGIALGVQVERPTKEMAYLPLLVEKEAAFVIQGRDLGMPEESIPLPDALKAAMAAGGHEVGLTARIRREVLEVTLCARAPGDAVPVQHRMSWPISAEQRRRLLSSPGAVLAKDGYQAVTPYFDDGRRPEPDLSVPAEPNRWRFAGDAQTYALFRSERRLGPAAPASLRSLLKTMLRAMDRDPKTQSQAMETYRRQFPRVTADLWALTTPEAQAALAELRGETVQ